MFPIDCNQLYNLHFCNKFKVILHQWTYQQVVFILKVRLIHMILFNLFLLIKLCVTFLLWLSLRPLFIHIKLKNIFSIIQFIIIILLSYSNVWKPIGIDMIFIRRHQHQFHIIITIILPLDIPVLTIMHINGRSHWTFLDDFRLISIDVVIDNIMVLSNLHRC